MSPNVRIRSDPKLHLIVLIPLCAVPLLVPPLLAVSHAAAAADAHAEERSQRQVWVDMEEVGH